MFFFHFACGDAISLHFVKWQNYKFNGLKSCTVRNMVTDIQYANSGISYLLSMDTYIYIYTFYDIKYHFIFTTKS